MKSIRHRIHRLIGNSIAVLSAVIIVIIALIANDYSKQNADRLLGEACHSQTLMMDGQLELIELAVQNLYVLAEKMRPSYEALSDPEKCDAFIEDYKPLALEIANKTTGCMTVYYRLNPDITGSGTTGFFGVSEDQNMIEEHVITDLFDFDSSASDNVGWYYIPIEAGEPIWMDAYYNANIDVNMISYVMPMYDQGRLLGVVGMDVDFERIISLIEDIDLYESGGACLYSVEKNLLYYKDSDALKGGVTEELRSKLTASKKAQSLYHYKNGGRDIQLSFSALRNGMKLIAYADSKEIYKQRNLFILVGILFIVIAHILTYIITIRIANRITKPIAELTTVTRRYAEGDWEASATCNSQDELQLLSENVSLMAENTRKYISYINDLAQKDGLTGLYNKAFYLQHTEQLQSAYRKNKEPYAIVVLDVNNLKYINDKYGHEKGDELLLAASRMISEKFPGNNYFRIGGDEFVVTMEGAGFSKLEQQLSDFQTLMSQAADPDDISQVCIASGASVCPTDGENYEELFQLADERMYANKKELKNGNLSR